MEKITVHFLEQSRAHRILWLLAELDLPYELVSYPRDPKTMRAPKSLQAIHPLGKSPVVKVGDEVLAESGAIIEYFVDATGRLGPDAAHRQAFRYWMHYAEGSMMPPLLVKLITQQLRNAPVPFFIKPIAKGIAAKIDANYTQAEIDLNSGFVNAHLKANAFFCGDEFTAVDIQMSYPVAATLDNDVAKVDVAAAKAWLDRVKARPGYQKAIEVGGPPDLRGR